LPDFFLAKGATLFGRMAREKNLSERREKIKSNKKKKRKPKREKQQEKSEQGNPETATTRLAHDNDDDVSL
jgi:hypothetical protein